MAGPTLRAMLKPMLFSATAPGSSARDTMSPTDACHAGALNAAPQPIRNVSDSNSQGVIDPVHAQMASSTETDEHETLRGEHDLATIEVVGHRAGDQRQQHRRQRDRRLHQRNHVGRLRDARSSSTTRRPTGSSRPGWRPCWPPTQRETPGSETATAPRSVPVALRGSRDRSKNCVVFRRLDGASVREASIRCMARRTIARIIHAS